jgi:hypothetical protein
MADYVAPTAEVWRREAITCVPQHEHKISILERLSLERVVGDLQLPGVPLSQVGVVSYRFGYFVVAGNGRWHWGQYALQLAADQLTELLETARQEGTLLPGH